MKADKVLFSLAAAAKGERVVHVCRDGRAATDSFEGVGDLLRLGVLNPGVQLNMSRRRVTFPGGGWAEFRDFDAHWHTGNSSLRTVIYDEAADQAAAAMRGSKP